MSIPKIIYRNTSTEFAQKFLEEGEVLFRPLSYYAAIEDTTRQDSGEGSVSRKFYSGKLTLIQPDIMGKLQSLDIKEATLNFLIESPDDVYVACFSICRQPKFGKVTVVIEDASLFVRMIAGLLQAVGIKLFADNVQYYDQETVDLEFAMKKLGFMKSSAFSEEQEYRLAFRLPPRHEYRSNLDPEPIQRRYLIVGVRDLSHIIRLET